MSLTRRIMVAAEPELTASLAEQFSAFGRFALREGALPALGDEGIDALILDESLYGRDALAKARRRGLRSFVLLIAREPKPPPEGVNAVVARPFRFADLVALIDSAPRPAPGANIGPYRFEARELRGPAGARVKLTEKEAAILSRLAEAEGGAVSRESLLRDVWGYGPGVSTRTLETHICRLRRKLEPAPDSPRWLITEGAAYRLAGLQDDLAS